MPDPNVVIEITPVGGGPSVSVPSGGLEDAPIREALDTDYFIVIGANGEPARIPKTSLTFGTPTADNAVVTESGEVIVTETGEAIVF